MNVAMTLTIEGLVRALRAAAHALAEAPEGGYADDNALPRRPRPAPQRFNPHAGEADDRRDD